MFRLQFLVNKSADQVAQPHRCFFDDNCEKVLSKLLPWQEASYEYPHMSRVMRKSAFCICENKDADQLRGNREADQRLCFRYIDSTISLLPKSEILSL